MSPLFELRWLTPGAVRYATGKGNGDASARFQADTPKYASFLRPLCVRLCVFVRCVRSHAAGAPEGTVHSARLHRSRAPDGGITVALPMAVAATTQNGRKQFFELPLA
jgi:hypothetical protein